MTHPKTCFALVAAFVAGAVAASPARAQPTGNPPSADTAPVDVSAKRKKEIDDAVAKALLERGKVLYADGDHADAKKMFIESLERSPDGPSSNDALAMLHSANERLGLEDLDHGNPIGKPVGSGADEPTDPYANGGGDNLADPYANNGNTGEGPVDPYGTGGGATPPRKDLTDPGIARRRVTLWSSAYGLLAGLAAAGPTDDQGTTRGAAILVGLLGAGAFGGASWYWLGKHDLTPGQGQAFISGGTWGAYTFALLGDAVTGIGTTSTNEGFKSAAIGGVVGAVGGAVYAAKAEPTEGDVSLINSMGMYGSGAGLLLGVVMQPPKGEAYSINGAVGAFAGLGAGMLMARKYDVSRGRMLRIDLGAAAGVAATWALFYPLVADNSTNNDEQAAGVISIGAMGLGAYLAWRWTRGMDDKGEPLGARPVASSVVQRTADGHWLLGAPLPRPMENPALAPTTGAFTLGLDLASGRF